MPIQLIITGDHITDVFAEISNFAAAINAKAPVTTPVGACHPELKVDQKLTASVKSSVQPTEPAKLSREEQDAAAEEMIEAGEKDARYDLLTKGRQKAVDDGIAAKAAPSKEEATDDDLEDMFGEGDDAPEAAPVVTADTIRDMMGKLGKDEDGNAIQDNLVKIRDILTRFVTKGKEIKVGNIPAEKLPAVYAELKKLEA